MLLIERSEGVKTQQMKCSGVVRSGKWAAIRDVDAVAGKRFQLEVNSLFLAALSLLQWPSGTTYVTFEDVKVPVENLIGKENQVRRAVPVVLCGTLSACV
jgi:alkylation response protein AidB-like acyl-CoA dehydrogenase